MKSFYYLIIAIIFSFLSFGFSSATPYQMPIQTVILDAGHGGYDPGAIAGDHQEKDIVLSVTQNLAAYLQQWFPDLTVVLTRSEDQFISLDERVAITMNHPLPAGSSAVMVSIHANASHTSDARGVEILMKPTDRTVPFLSQRTPDWALFRYANHTSGELNHQLNRENLLLATFINERLMQHLPAVRNRGIKEQEVWILTESVYPSALVEIGFMSNEQELQALIDLAYQASIARAIAEGIADYINLY